MNPREKFVFYAALERASFNRMPATAAISFGYGSIKQPVSRASISAGCFSRRHSFWLRHGVGYNWPRPMPATINGRMKPWMDRVYNIIKRGTIWNQIQRSVPHEGGRYELAPRQTALVPFYRYLDFIIRFTTRRVHAFRLFPLRFRPIRVI